MDVFELLHADHQAAEKQFKKLLDQEPIDRAGVDTLCEALRIHMQAEEKHLYPVLKEIRKMEDIAEEGDLEHREAKTFMKALTEDKLEEAPYKVKLEMLHLAIEHHVEEEEQEMFPKARKALSTAQVAELTEKMAPMLEKSPLAAKAPASKK